MNFFRKYRRWNRTMGAPNYGFIGGEDCAEEYADGQGDDRRVLSVHVSY